MLEPMKNNVGAWFWVKQVMSLFLPFFLLLRICRKIEEVVVVVVVVHVFRSIMRHFLRVSAISDPPLSKTALVERIALPIWRVFLAFPPKDLRTAAGHRVDEDFFY